MIRSEILARVFSRHGPPIAVLTAYDALTAQLALAGGADALLVGDSLGTTVQGHSDTHAVTLEQMCYHTEIVARCAGQTPVIADLPIGTYATPDQARNSARQLMEAGAWAVKFEGNPGGVAAALVAEGIPVMGHLGLLPQTTTSFKVHGRDAEEARRVLQDAVQLRDQGAFALVLECVPDALADTVQAHLDIPVIGIGAGRSPHGQVLVIYDLLQVPPRSRWPRFVPTRYPAGGDFLLGIIRTWVGEVRSGAYPQDGESYG